MPWVMCGVPRGTQEYLSPLCARAQGPAPAPGENLALWPCLIVLPRAAQSHPPCYPVQCYPFALLGLPYEPLPDIQRPCHIWDSTDSFLPGLWAEGPGYCSDPHEKAR